MTDQAAPPIVLVVAFRADDHLGACLAAVGPSARVTVIDNDASDSTRQIAGRAGAGYLASARNCGFAGAVNLGLRHAWSGTEDVLLLNPDARIGYVEVVTLQRALHAPGKRRAAVGPRLVTETGRRQRADWPLPSPGQVWFDAFGLGRLWRGRRFVTGAVLLLRADALAEIGEFDERYFLYAEEADWQLRAQRAGWTVAVVDAVTAVHAGGASSSDGAVREALFHASGRTFARQWYGRLGTASMRCGSIVAALRRTVFGSRAARTSARRSLRLLLRPAAGPPA